MSKGNAEDTLKFLLIRSYNTAAGAHVMSFFNLRQTQTGVAQLHTQLLHKYGSNLLYNATICSRRIRCVG